MRPFYLQQTCTHRAQKLRRKTPYRLLKAKKSKSEIAKLMGRDRSTIYREIERNTGGRGYRPKQAQRKADERRLRCRREPKMNDPKDS